MIPYKKIERQLKKLGLTKNENISDFWFENMDRLMPLIYGKGHHNGQFGKQVRWKSEIGEVCQNAIRKFIELKIKEHRNKSFKDFDSEQFDRSLKDAYCSFKKAHLVSINLIHTLISGNFEGATLNVIYPLNDRTIHLPFEIKKINYFDLLKLSWLFFNSKRIITLKDKRHTHFLANTTKDIESPHLLELKNYINWYQESFGDPHSPVRNTFTKKFKYFLSVLFTKNWTSITVLAVWFFLINIFYSVLIYFGNSHFRTSSDFFKPDIFQAFYHSMITFSILGYGDLNPIDNWGRFLVLSEAIIGFIILGLFIFLLSRKIEKK